MSVEITEYISQCEICSQYSAKQAKETLTGHRKKSEQPYAVLERYSIVSKVISELLWYALLHSVIGSKFSCHSFNQSTVKPKSIVARACIFSRALCRLHVITSRFDWFTGLFPSFLIGQNNYFGFDFTTFD